MFEWDEKKSRSNFVKHGVEFKDVWEFDWTHAIRTPSGSFEYGEIRFIALGKIENRLYACVYTPRGDNYRVISLRKANKREEKIYGEKID